MQLGELAGLKPAKRMREVFGDAILDLCRNNEKVVILDGDLASTTYTKGVRLEIPDRFYNIGIAESNMISMAAGLAECGYIPVASSLASFILANGYDQLRVSVAVAGVNVKVVGSHGGITLTAQGRALENGTVGDTIQVVNTQSSRTIDARVEGTGVVRVTAPGAAVKG